MPARRTSLPSFPPLPEPLPRGIRHHRSGYIVDVTVNGRRKTRTARTIPEAIAARQELLSTLCQEKPQAARRGWTLKEAVERTWQTVWADKASQDTIRINVDQVLSYFGESCPIIDITLSAIDGFVSNCAAKGNSGATINRKLSCLSRILRTAHERGALPVLPRMPKRRESEHRIRFLSRKEEERMLIIIERLALPDVQDAVMCLLYTGFRCGELWRLECRDIDLERGTLTAWKTKNRHPRTIPLVEKLRPIIERRMEACGGSGRLFPEGSNEWLRRPWDIIRYHMGMSEDPQFVPHMLRHTCATRLSQSGVSLPLIKEWMGHTSITTTARYAHFSPDDLRAAATLLGK